MALARELVEHEGTDIESAAANLWHARVAPMLAEIDGEARRNHYMRELLSVLTEGRDGWVSAASVGVAVFAAASGISVLLPAVASAIYPFARAFGKTVERRELAQKNRLLFLHHAQRRMVDGRRERSRRKQSS